VGLLRCKVIGKIISIYNFKPNKYSVRTFDPVSKIKISKNKIIPMPSKSGLRTVKNTGLKKSRNLYYELKNAMTQKLANINNFETKRNSLNYASSKYIFHKRSFRFIK
jgi:hypothetical protein